jgi:ketosteroid isomerase-like protein
MLAPRFLLATVLLAAVGCEASAPKSASKDAEAVQAANSGFYVSLNALFTGDAQPMHEVWSHADDVTYMGPGGGFLRGWIDVRDRLDAQAALKLGGTIEPVKTHVAVGDDLAFVQCYERGSNHDAQGLPVQVSIRATSVFRKENGAWKMIGHHTDLLPFLEKETLAM